MAKPGPQRGGASIEALRERMARDPLSRAFLQLAEEYRKAGRHDEAIAVCLEGLARHPTYHTARISLGRTYLEAGRLDEARRALAEVLDLAPENHLAGKLLAEVQRRTGDVAAAMETYRSILRHYPGDREVEALLKDILEVQGTPPPAPASAPAPGSGGRAQQAVRPAPWPAAPVPATPRPAAAQVLPLPPQPASPVSAPRPAPSAPRPVATATSSVAEPSLEYGPEDITPAPAAPDRLPARSEGTDALHTNTLAELYLRQGLIERAIEVYRAMLRVDPGNGKAARRLQELAAEPAGPRGAVEEAGPAPGAGEARAAALRLGRWLETIQAGSGGPRQAGPR